MSGDSHGGGHGGDAGSKALTWVLVIIGGVVAYNLLMATVTGSNPMRNSGAQQFQGFTGAPPRGHIGHPTGNGCDPSNPRPYQRNGKWFICIDE